MDVEITYKTQLIANKKNEARLESLLSIQNILLSSPNFNFNVIIFYIFIVLNF